MAGSEQSSQTASQDANGSKHPRTSTRPGLARIFPRELERAAQTWTIRRPALVGRSREADVCLEDARASRRHAAVERAEAGLRVRDLGSRHGTFVNGNLLGTESVAAPCGSVIRVGGTLLLVVDDVVPYTTPPHRVGSAYLGTREDIVVGPALFRAWQQASRVAALRHPVLVQGESGSGKEAIARFLHAARETKGPFVALNAAAIPEGLFESELFGHARGAFTGAVASRLGAFREAQGGVLFLDEIADLALDLQVKLLRAIDQMRVRPLGSREDVPVDVRVVAATSRDLRDACSRGSFRLDMYYRLAGVVIEVPPLRARRDDVITLALAMLGAEGKGYGLSPDAAEALVLARWEGNVRQLHHAVTQASVHALAHDRAEILSEDLPELRPAEIADEAGQSRARVEAALRGANGNVSRAAKRLGVSRAGLYNLFRRYDIDPGELRAGRARGSEQ